MQPLGFLMPYPIQRTRIYKVPNLKGRDGRILIYRQLRSVIEVRLEASVKAGLVVPLMYDRHIGLSFEPLFVGRLGTYSWRRCERTAVEHCSRCFGCDMAEVEH